MQSNSSIAEIRALKLSAEEMGAAIKQARQIAGK